MARFGSGRREALTLVAEGKMVPALVREADGWHARWRPSVPVSSPEVADILDAFVRRATVTPLSADSEDHRHETVHDAWLEALRSLTGLVREPDADCAAFAAELSSWHGAAEDDEEVRRGLVFAFAAEGAEGRFSIRCAAPRGRRALKALGGATFVFGPLRGLRSTGRGQLAVELTRAETEAFLGGGAAELAAAGFSVEGVELKADVGVAASVVADAGKPDAKDGTPPPFKAKLVVRVDGQAVGADEIRFLLEQKSSLVFFRDRWIEVDRNILKEALRALERQDGRALGTSEALAFASGIGFAGRLAIREAESHGWLRGLLNELRGEDRFDPSRLALPAGAFRGELRGYQLRGAAWMRFLVGHGFGALLADDMGLGKTVQTIACILSLDRPKGEPVLVVAPLTLLANWRHEFAAFAPGLEVLVHHGDGRLVGTAFARSAARADVVVTSYSLLVRDHAALRDVAWHALVLDEAQAIKNFDSQAARAARALGVPRRIALTGTPVENSAADVWGLEEFLNPGFLGDRKAFEENYVKPLDADALAAAGRRLRHALEPFLLRRLKTDPGIAGELGEKREIREYCPLDPAARRDYEAALAEFRSGERTCGDVFALITRLKLVCDGLGAEASADASETDTSFCLGGGKFERLCELLESVFAAGESALVFTQYAKVGAAVAKGLAVRFRRPFPFLHGALDAKGREREIARFNAGGASCPTAFVLSLRAGGFGLNLTKATRVIHFDRWWNPAVENQATDRAHRIGQGRTVFVHVFMAEGTIEEHVDEILRRKSVLASSLVTGGESFLAKMSAEEFDRTVALDGEVR